MAEPRYRQIAKDLREQIKTGRIAPDGPRPTGLGFRDRYNASRNAVKDAIKWLTADGAVTAKSGQGIFAVPGAAAFAVTLSVSAETGLSVVQGAAEFAEIARHGRRPWASVPRVEVRSASPDMGPQLPRRGRRAAVERGREQVLRLSGGRRGACRHRGHRTGYRASAAGPAPFRASSTVFPADRVRIVINAGDVPRDGTPPVDNEHQQAAGGERRAGSADDALRHSEAAQARQVPHALAHPTRRLPGYRSASVFPADGPADGEEGAEQNTEDDGSDERECDEGGDEACHDGLQPSVPRRIRGSAMSPRFRFDPFGRMMRMPGTIPPGWLHPSR